MTSISANTVAVGAAMRWEVEAVLAALRRHGEVQSDRSNLWSGAAGSTSVLVYRTGVGIKAARRSTRELLQRFSPALIINTGCAGALESGWEPGDIAVATTVLGPPPGCERWTVAPPIHEVICEVANATGRRSTRAATQLTTRRPLLRAVEKRNHGLEWAAQVVEMESAGVAQAAAGHCCPFASARVILDPMQSELPDLTLSGARGRSTAGRMVGLLRSPRQAYRAAALYRNGRRARIELSHFCNALFDAIRAGTIDPGLLGLR